MNKIALTCTILSAIALLASFFWLLEYDLRHHILKQSWRERSAGRAAAFFVTYIAFTASVIWLVESMA